MMDIIAFEKKSGPKVAVNFYAKARGHEGMAYIKKRLVMTRKEYDGLAAAIRAGAEPRRPL